MSHGQYTNQNLLFRPGEVYGRNEVFSPERTRSPSAKRDGSRKRSQTPGRRSSRSPSRGGTRDRSPLRESRENQAPPPPVNSLFEQEDDTVFGAQWQLYASQQSVLQGMQQMPIMDQIEIQEPWVTVYGIEQQDLPVILEELSKCGNIVRYGNFGASERSNWIHIEFENKYAAQMALQKNGTCLDNNRRQFLIGVKPVSEEHKSMINGNSMDSQQPVDFIGTQQLSHVPFQPAKSQNFQNLQSSSLQQRSSDKTFWHHVYDAVVGT